MDNVSVISSTKFKNSALSLIIPVDLNEKAADYNLITAILKRGCMKYPTTQDVWKHLQELYGAVFDIMVSKKGEKLFLNFYIQFMDNKYTLNNENLLFDAISLLNEILNNPLVEGGAFNKVYFDTEKENLKDLINSRTDNKDNYAVERVQEISTKGEPFSHYKYGTVERLDAISNEELYTLWIKTYTEAPRYFFACGDIKEEDLAGKIDGLMNKGAINTNIPYIGFKESFEEVTEEMDVNQGKLTIGYRSDVSIFNGDYFALSVMNSVLGGGTHSKLFNEVREKNSLAYYSYSFIEKFKGLLVIACGVDLNNFSKAKDICIEQVENIKSGNVSDKEINSSISKMVSDLKTVQDTQYSIIDYVSSLKAYGINYTLEDVINNIKTVTRERIIETANKLQLSTIYYLKNKS